MNNNDIVILDTTDVKFPEHDLKTESLYQIREKSLQETDVEVSIYIQAYNRLEKTKRCVEAILENTDEDYELVLVDNGSDDGTFEYFQSINRRKKIVRVTHNVGTNYPISVAKSMCSGKYIVTVANDLYVTKYWLRNMLNCMKSDERIGMVVPRSTNVSNLQGVYDYKFTTVEAFMKDAEKFNEVSDPRKWEERLRLITLASMYRRSAWDLVGENDSIFVHDFAEDDICARLRFAGYKMMLAGDTFIHHDHNVFAGEDKDPEEFDRLLRQGREAYREKYHGLDAWDDILNFEYKMLEEVIPPSTAMPSILGIDVRCGHPILTLSNKLREKGIFHNERYAFTRRAKYFRDLQFVCGGENVECDRIEYLDEYYANGTMDYIILGEPVNTYANPGQVLVKLMNKLKTGGCLYFKLRNTSNYKAYLHIAGRLNVIDNDMPIAITVEEMCDTIELLGAEDMRIGLEFVEGARENLEALKDMAIQVAGTGNVQSVLDKLITKNYCFCVRK